MAVLDALDALKDNTRQLCPLDRQGVCDACGRLRPIALRRFLPPKVGLPNADPSPNAALFIGSLLSCLAFFSYWPSSKPYPTKSSFLSFF